MNVRNILAFIFVGISLNQILQLPVPYLTIAQPMLIVGFIVFFIFRFLVKGLKRGDYSHELFWTITIAVMTVASPVKAFMVFGQPLMLGLQTQAVVTLPAISSIITVILLKQGFFTLNAIKKSILFWILSVILIQLPMYLFIDGKIFVEKYPLVARGQGVYSFDPAIACIGLFLSLWYIFFKKKYAYLILAFLMAFFIFAVNGKVTTIFSLALSFFVSLYFIFGWRKFSLALILILYLAAFVFLLLLLIGPGTESGIYRDFYYAFLLLSEGSALGDAGTDIRAAEFDIAKTFIWENPFFGNGKIANDWSGGIESVLGYFYPSDIGIFGVVFVYGLIPTFLILSASLVKVVRRDLVSGDEAAFAYSIFATLIMLFTQGFARGGVFLSPVTLVFLSLLLQYLFALSASKRALLEGDTGHRKN
ncbi:hypothetical protein [Rhizobium sp. L1K21]|uniref:hypothetical protein n=1 Tax=Rhizobium sp. L1K21 TaxID=2954933 RepID=UPI00209350C1|nr:hypothetical protein [Rhizobium sp. L1K21]MCO6184852.1 hypothetical protein [Rhizobium sp. L1K21]